MQHMVDWELTSLHGELNRYKDLKINTVNTILYLEIIEKVAKRRNLSSVPLLLAQFRDDPEYYPILEAAKHAIERYYSNVYVKVVSKHMDILVKNAPEWACTFLFEIFQTPAYLEEFRSSILNAKPKEVLKLLFAMEERLDVYKEFVDELRARLNSTSPNG